jgi:hypothetical protein
MQGVNHERGLDTLKFANRLKSAGLTDEQAQAFAEAQKDVFAEALETSLATKLDIMRLEAKLDHEASLLKWMMGVILAVALANFAKQFF